MHSSDAIPGIQKNTTVAQNCNTDQYMHLQIFHTEPCQNAGNARKQSLCQSSHNPQAFPAQFRQPKELLVVGTLALPNFGHARRFRNFEPILRQHNFGIIPPLRHNFSIIARIGSGIISASKNGIITISKSIWGQSQTATQYHQPPDTSMYRTFAQNTWTLSIARTKSTERHRTDALTV